MGAPLVPPCRAKRSRAATALATASIALALALLGVGACAAFGTTVDHESEPSPDSSSSSGEANGSPTGDATTTDGGSVDAPVDGFVFDAGFPVPPNCTLVVVDDFSAAMDPRWKLSGEAKYRPDELFVAGTVDQKAGAMWIATPSGGGSLHARFKLHLVDDDKEHGEAMTIAWAQQAAEPQVGGSGISLGLCGPVVNNAVGLVVETLTPHSLLKIDTISCAKMSLASIVLADAGKDLEETIEVHLTKGALVGSLTVTSIDKQAALATPIAFNTTVRALSSINWVGFTASTGSIHSEHAVDNVVIYVCP